MKKIIISMIIVLSAAGVVSAQNPAPNPFAPRGDQQKGVQQQDVQQTSISGKLAFVNGRIAVQGASAVYYASGVNRLIGFVDGLKEGASVTLDGFLLPAPPNASGQFFRTSKLTFSGKTYDLGAGQANQMGQNFPRNQMSPRQGRKGTGQQWQPQSQQRSKNKRQPKRR